MRSSVVQNGSMSCADELPSPVRFVPSALIVLISCWWGIGVVKPWKTILVPSGDHSGAFPATERYRTLDPSEFIVKIRSDPLNTILVPSGDHPGACAAGAPIVNTKRSRTSLNTAPVEESITETIVGI